MKHCFAFAFLALLAAVPLTLAAQRVGINTPSPDTSAILELKTNKMGFLPPRLTTAQRDAIPLPAEGLVIYNTETHCLNFYNGSTWIATCNDQAPCSPPPTPVPTQSSITLCAGQTLQLSCTDLGAGFSYLWNGPNNYRGTGINPTAIGCAQPIATGTYTVRSWAFGCYSSPANVNVTINTSGWNCKANVPAGASNIRQCVLVSDGSKLYLIGGSDAGYNVTTQMWIYDPSTDTWSSGAPTPVGRRAANAFVIGSKIYWGTGFCCSLGGSVASEWYVYDIPTNTWSAALAPYLSHHNMAFSIGTKGYLGLGSPNSGCTSPVSEVKEYNPATNTWTLISNCPATPTTTFCFPQSQVVGSTAYIILDDEQFWSFTPGTLTWTRLANFPSDGIRNLMRINNILYGVASNSSMYQYNMGPNTWTRLSCDFPGVATEYEMQNIVEINGKSYYVDLLNKKTWEFTP